MTGFAFEILCKGKMLGVGQDKLFWFGIELARQRRLIGMKRFRHMSEVESVTAP